MVNIEVHKQNLEVAARYYGNDYFVWFNLHDGVQVTVALEWDVIETIILSEVRQTYTDPDQEDSVREAIAVLIKEVWTHGAENDAIKLAAMDREYQQNKKEQA
jgi:hypothetical protein